MVLKNPGHINYTRGPFSVSDRFLAKQTNTDAAINYYIQYPENVNNALGEFYTLLIDLRKPLEKIREEVYHRTLAEINSFTANQHFEHKILFPIPENELNYFIKLFNSFAKEKKIRKAESYRLKAYNRHGILALSSIKQEGQHLCVNFYRLTRERAGNLHSFTIKGNQNSPFNNSHLGRAHRALHWLDVLAFKKEGVYYYDFCGWYDG